MRLLVALFVVAMPLQARTRAVHSPAHSRILCVGAHPDDESLLAPLLGRECVEEKAACTLLVLTRGENGECKLPGGCGDLGAIRAAEMVAAGDALHARVIQWSLPDVFTPEADWPAVGEQLAAVISAEKPDVIYTFDPNHGSTCHPAHRYTGQLVLKAAAAVPVFLIETAIRRVDGTIGFSSATASASAWDLRRWWSWMVIDLDAHRSQFSSEEVRAIAHIPENQQRVWTLDRAALAGARYDFGCD